VGCTLKGHMHYGGCTSPNVVHAHEILMGIRACLGDKKIHTACDYWVPTVSKQNI